MVRFHKCADKGAGHGSVLTIAASVPRPGPNDATLIEPIGETHAASSTVLRVRSADDVEVVLGGRDNITPDAVPR